MKKSDELSLRASETRQRLNELAGKDGLNLEERAEVDSLSDNLTSIETQYRAALLGESAEERQARADGDGEGAEINRLIREVRCGNYLQSALDVRVLDGREAELNAAFNLLGSNEMPWEALLPASDVLRHGVERRADTDITPPSTGLPNTQHPILSRVFYRTSAAYLNVGMPTVPTGTSAYPVFATGTSASMAAREGVVDAETATFTSKVLKPVRLSAAYLFSIEDLVETSGLEESLRSDLSMAMGDEIDDQILNGNGTAPNVPGFLGGTDGGLGALPANKTVEAKYADYRALYTAEVDGKYANDASGVRVLVSPATYKHADSRFRSDSSEDTGLMAAMRIGGGFRVSGNMPAKASKNSVTLLYKGTAQAAVAPFWQGVRLIRDEITQAAKGQIRLTAIALWSFAVTRADQYKAVKLQIEA